MICTGQNEFKEIPRVCGNIFRSPGIVERTASSADVHGRVGRLGRYRLERHRILLFRHHEAANYSLEIRLTTMLGFSIFRKIESNGWLLVTLVVPHGSVSRSETGPQVAFGSFVDAYAKIQDYLACCRSFRISLAHPRLSSHVLTRPWFPITIFFFGFKAHRRSKNCRRNSEIQIGTEEKALRSHEEV